MQDCANPTLDLYWSMQTLGNRGRISVGMLIYRAGLPRGYKTLFMLISAEHEIRNAHKYKIYIYIIGIFQAQISRECNIFLLIIVGHFNIYEQEKFHAHPS